MSENGENLWNNFSDSAFERAVVNELRIDPISVTQSSLFRLESLTVDLVSPEDLKHLVHTPNLINLSIICYGDVDLEDVPALFLAREVDKEDLMRFDHEDTTFCVYNTGKGFFATAGICTHEEEHLEYGMVIDNVIECPLHQGRFDIPSGKALSAPACVDLKTYPVKVEDGDIFIAPD